MNRPCSVFGTLRSGSVRCLVVPLLGGDDDGKQDRLQPSGRRTAAILPLISRRTGATQDADKLRCGNLGEVFLEGHGEILPQKKKCAMQKKVLAMHTMQGYLSRVSQPHKKMKARNEKGNSHEEAIALEWLTETESRIANKSSLPICSFTNSFDAIRRTWEEEGKLRANHRPISFEKSKSVVMSFLRAGIFPLTLAHFTTNK